MIRLAGNPDPVWRALANDPDANARTREGVAHNQFRIDTQLAPKLPNLILKKLMQRLDQRETLPVRHTLWQPSYIAVGLDCRRRALEADGLNHIRVESALYKPFNFSGIWRVLGLLLNLLIAEAAHRPVLPRSTDIHSEVLQQLDTPRRIADFRVGLNTENRLFLISNST